ncbi:hypothetical protein ACFLVP_03165 [Chloroflexota bacterium]
MSKLDEPLRDQRRLERIVPTKRVDCPKCGRPMSIFGNSQRLDYRYNCTGCGYYGFILTQNELHALL